MQRNFYLVVMAGGQGLRMGADKPKQFIEIEGVPILQHTISRFVSALPSVKVVTVMHRDWKDTWKEHCLRSNYGQPQTIVEGGFTRFHSVKNALKRVPDGAIVAIHDGVRPLVSEKLIASMADVMAAGNCHALIPVVPVTDTLKCLSKGSDGRYVDEGEADRSRLFGAQTPQFFLSEEIKQAYCQPYDVSFTDDASVARRAGIPLRFCEGERLNIKITCPDDLLIARALLGRGD